ncbi:MAG: hydantoinase/oxoprolinase family protein [Peptococcaceae bacterium]
MLDIGIDVGGTFTDGVLVDGTKVLKSCKVPTLNNNLLASIGDTLDKLVHCENRGGIARVVVSTTLMTNLILEEKYEKTGLLLLPGPGISCQEYHFPFPFETVRGAVDFQGRIVEETDPCEIVSGVTKLLTQDIKNLGIICKFSPRNPALELQVQEIVKKHFSDLKIALGHEVTGNLNFVRRAMSTGLFLATGKLFRQFIFSLEELIREKSLQCPLYILKADGGIIPIAHADKFSVDTIFSGPAASALGAKALFGLNSSAVVLDMGGTTTDLSLILDDRPLYASKGVKIADNYTHIRSLAVHSIPLGGDTSIRINESRQPVISFRRDGLPVCLGGEVPTITDCMRVLELTDLGDKEPALHALQEYGEKINKNTDCLAGEVLDQVLSIISATIEKILHDWQEEPAYRIWQLMNKKELKPGTLICLGGPAAVIGNLFKQKTGFKIRSNSLCTVANAIGTALALPTFAELVRFNTHKGEISSSWGFFRQEAKIKGNKQSQEVIRQEAVSIFQKYLRDHDMISEPEVISHEVFNMVRNWDTTGQIHEVLLSIPSGIKSFVEHKE